MRRSIRLSDDTEALSAKHQACPHSGYWTSTIPDGFTHKVEILASGATPGVLEPGESIKVPIDYDGCQQLWDGGYPDFNYQLGVEQTTDPTPIPWSSLAPSLEPPDVSAAEGDGSRLPAHASGGRAGFLETSFQTECSSLVRGAGPLSSNLRALDIDPSGRFLVASDVGGLAIWDLASRTQVALLPVTTGGRCIPV